MLCGLEILWLSPVFPRRSAPTISQMMSGKSLCYDLATCPRIQGIGPAPRRPPGPLTFGDHPDPYSKWERDCCQADQIGTRERSDDQESKGTAQGKCCPLCRPREGGLMRGSILIARVRPHGRARSCSMRSLRYRVKGTPLSAAFAFIASSKLSASRMFSTADFGSNSKLDGRRDFSARRLRPTDRVLDRVSAMSSRSPILDARGGNAVSLWIILADCIYKRNAFQGLRPAGICFRLGGVCT